MSKKVIAEHLVTKAKVKALLDDSFYEEQEPKDEVAVVLFVDNGTLGISKSKFKNEYKILRLAKENE